MLQRSMSRACCRRRRSTDDRPRKGWRIWRHLRGHQQHHLDQSRLELHQRFSPIAAGCSAVIVQAGSHQPHRTRKTSSITTSRTAAGNWCRSPPSPSPIEWSKGLTQIVWLQLLSRRAHLGEARPGFTSAMPSTRWSGWPTSCRAVSAMNVDRTIVAGKTVVACRRYVPARAFGAGRVLVARRRC